MKRLIMPTREIKIPGHPSVTLRYNYNWLTRTRLAIQFSYIDLAKLLEHLNKPNLHAVHLNIAAIITDPEGNSILTTLELPNVILFKSAAELRLMNRPRIG